MPRPFLIAILVGILAACMPGVQIAATFDPGRVRVIDSNEERNSILVRGNAPLNRHGDYDPEMVLRHLAQEQNTKQQQHLNKLVVISLLSSRYSDENAILLQAQLAMEEMSVWKHEFHHRPIVGSWLAPPPTNKSELVNEWIWKHWKPDDGAWEMAAHLKKMIQQVNNTAVYFHCMRGMDRTGLVAGAYMARWKNATADEIDHANYDVAKRKLNLPARNALRWVVWKSQRAFKSESSNFEP